MLSARFSDVNVLPSPGSGTGYLHHVVASRRRTLAAGDGIQEWPLDASQLVFGLALHLDRRQPPLAPQPIDVELHDALEIARGERRVVARYLSARDAGGGDVCGLACCPCGCAAPAGLSCTCDLALSWAFCSARSMMLMRSSSACAMRKRRAQRLGQHDVQQVGHDQQADRGPHQRALACGTTARGRVCSAAVMEPITGTPGDLRQQVPGT